MRFLTTGALAIVLAALPTQRASAWGYSRFSLGFNICWEHQGGSHETVRYRHHVHHAPQPPCPTCMVGLEHAQPQVAQWQQAPPPDRRMPDRKEEEMLLQWGYPSLGYSYYHPVSYYQDQSVQQEPPTYYYSAPQTYYPAAYGGAGYYPPTGVTFDR